MDVAIPVAFAQMRSVRHQAFEDRLEDAGIDRTRQSESFRALAGPGARFTMPWVVFRVVAVALIIGDALRRRGDLADRGYHRSRSPAVMRDPVAEREVAEALQSVETFWEDLFPLERNRLIRLLVEKVEIRETGIDMELKTRGMTSLIIELSGLASEARERSNGR